jgi:prepilin-type N-terminal cleavage/methylation domain-containing protein
VRRAFTLIELLVVITIIATLISLLLPAVAKSRRTAQSTAGFANMRSCAMILAAYTNENRDDFLNPFRRQWPNDAAHGGMTWTMICSEADPAQQRWDFASPLCPPTSTEGFATVWYSYLAEYRGGHRADAESVSPADGDPVVGLRDAAGDPETLNGRNLVPGSFYYSPTFWSTPERYAGGCRPAMTPEMLQTATLAAVRYPAAKVLIWERGDFASGRTALDWNDPRAHGHVATVDGSIDTVTIRDILQHAVSESDLIGVNVCCPLPTPPPPPPLFWATLHGYKGRDLPR